MRWVRRHSWERWTPRRSATVIHGDGETIDGFADIVIVNYEILDRHVGWLGAHGFRGMVVDEAHFIKNLTSQRSKLVLSLAASLRQRNPDPLLLAQSLARDAPPVPARPGENRELAARYAIFAVAASHVTMASVMAMTPVHLAHLVGGEHAGHAASTETVTLVVGTTIAVHVLGMYGLSPLFGALSDRFGRVALILVGQAMLAASLIIAAVFTDNRWGVMIALFLLGAGWSAATVAGAALLTDATPLERRPARQGLSDSIMTLSAAVGSVLAGVVLAWIGYGGLALCALVLVAAVTALSPAGRSGARVTR